MLEEEWESRRSRYSEPPMTTREKLGLIGLIVGLGVLFLFMVVT